VQKEIQTEGHNYILLLSFLSKKERKKERKKEGKKKK
jgi:hypothetical protein